MRSGLNADQHIWSTQDIYYGEGEHGGVYARFRVPPALLGEIHALVQEAPCRKPEEYDDAHYKGRASFDANHSYIHQR